MPQQLEFFSIDSPCKGICQSDARGYCVGCLRSRDERFQWNNYDDGQKREVLRLCQQRMLRQKKGNQANSLDIEPQQQSLF